MDFVTISTELNANVDEYIKFLISAMAGLATVGILSMALVEVLKSFALFGWSVRGVFYRYHLRKFLIERRACVDTMEQFICVLSAGGIVEFYAQESPAIFQGMGSIKNLTLSQVTEDENREFIRVFTKDKSEQDQIKQIFSKAQPSNKKEILAYLTELVGASITGLEVVVTRRWTFCKQSTAVLISIILICKFAPIDDDVSRFIYGFIGGLIAPFAHDLISKIKPMS